ncbi:hypothetical protein QBC40DRAFT_298322 [Triangularia verruculosa]|uniref:Uncharacterized protein n=1 Tax=Triangularia verruculosa TaxID=2587418 RepID=A0AAN6XDP1_9PEZI|nr:hypothetical protein QBC40DRAFT_298322 [Triangularia verruculosa]
MPTADGTFFRNSANRVTAVFIIDEIQMTFTATVAPSIQPFTSKSATLTYDDVESLTSTRSYSGLIGTDTYALIFDNGPKITGNLNVPGISPANTVAGTGVWEQN